MKNRVRQAGLTANRTEQSLDRKSQHFTESVCMYQAGKAVYPSSVLMNIVPAKVAGVDEIMMVTPPGKDGKGNTNYTGCST